MPVNGDRNRKQGFTLIELLIAMLIASLLLGSMYSVYTSHYSTFRKQEQIAEAQQNARGALQLMSRDIIMAGYSTSTDTPPNNKGIIFANETSLNVHYANKFISYSRYSSARIGRREGGARQAVAERVRRLRFRYIDNEGKMMGPDPLSGNVLAEDVQQILISVTASTPVFGGYSRSCTLETTLAPRNLK